MQHTAIAETCEPKLKLDSVDEETEMARKITARDEEIGEMYVEGGLTIAAICAEVGVQPPTVYMALRKLGITPNRRLEVTAKPGTPERYELLIDDPNYQRVVSLYQGERKLNASAIAKETGLRYGKVLWYLHQAKVPLTPGKRSIGGKSLTRRIMEYVQKHKGENVGEVALFFGVNPAIVGRIMRKMGAFSLTFEHSEEGRMEAIIEEVQHRIREEGMGVTSGAPRQPKLPGL